MSGELCFKVLTPDRLSIWADAGTRVRYHPGHKTWAQPHMAELGYHLTVFQTANDAVKFLMVEPVWAQGLAVWSALGYGKIEPLPRPLTYTELCLAKAHGVNYRELPATPMREWPEGTMMYREVKLVNRVGAVEWIEEFRRYMVHWNASFKGVTA